MAHDARTLSVCVKVLRERPGHPPGDKVIWKEEKTRDLLHPESWSIDTEVSSDGVRYSFSMSVDVRRTAHEFFPDGPRDYIRFDVSGTAAIIPNTEPNHWEANTCWLDEFTQFAGTWLRINTPQSGLFIDLNVQFSP